MKIMIELIIVLFVLILIIIFLLYKIISNKFNIISIKLTKSEKKLMESLKNKFLLNIKMIDFLNEKDNFDENIFHEFLNLKLDKTNILDLNNVIIDTDKNIEKYLSNNEKLINKKEYITINKELSELNIIINASRKYYNDNILEYNKLIKKFPNNLVAKIKRLKEKDKLKEDHNKKLKILN